MYLNQLQDIICEGYRVWGGQNEDLLQWLITPCKALGGKKPIDCDYNDVIGLIVRIEHGIHS